MTPIEIIAFVLIIFILIKLVVIWNNPMNWKPVVTAIYGKPAVTIVVALVLGAIILRYLLAELTIVQIFASMTFMMALMMVQFALLGKELTELSDKYFEDRTILKRVWPALVLWLLLIAWVLYEIFV